MKHANYGFVFASTHRDLSADCYKLPQPLDDADTAHGARFDNKQSCSLAVSIHLFQLAKINSEIKYVANSIVRDVPDYAYPAIRDISAWQSSTLQKLNDWAATIPQTQPPAEYLKLTCELRCLTIKMLLLRPSPAIPNPTSAILRNCHESARRSLQLYERLYKSDLIIYDWITLHGVVFSTITALYCTRAVPEIAQTVEPGSLMEDMSVSLSILSATGEHWSGAKRARDILDDVGKITIRWLRQSRQLFAQRSRSENGAPSGDYAQVGVLGDAQVGQLMGDTADDCNTSGLESTTDFFPGIQFDLCLFPEFEQSREPFGDMVNIDNMMRNLFDDFIPSGPGFC